MKEAIGGTWIYVIVLAFIALFTCFVSVSTNYSRCFKIKDEILTTIEIYHGLNQQSVTRINDYLTGIGYSSEGNCPNDGNCWYGFSTSNDNGPSGYAMLIITFFSMVNLVYLIALPSIEESSPSLSLSNLRIRRTTNITATTVLTRSATGKLIHTPLIPNHMGSR